jgi:uncharacterized glyoxalase superfamily protein PhnB
VPGERGTVAHAQLTLGNGMIMLGSSGDDPYGALVKPAPDVGPLTASVYIIVPDADAHYARAKAKGAEIVFDIEDKDYGGRGYSARDPDGQLWNFGDVRSVGVSARTLSRRARTAPVR